MKNSLIFLLLFSCFGSIHAQSASDWQKINDFYGRKVCGELPGKSLRRMAEHPLQLLSYQEKINLFDEFIARESDIEFVIMIRGNALGVADSIWIVSPDGEHHLWHSTIVEEMRGSDAKWPPCYFPVDFNQEDWVVILPFSYFVIDSIERRNLPASVALRKLVYENTRKYLSITAPIVRSYTASIP